MSKQGERQTKAGPGPGPPTQALVPREDGRRSARGGAHLPAGYLLNIWFHSLPCFFHTESLWPWGDFSSSSSISTWHQQERQPQGQRADSGCVCLCVLGAEAGGGELGKEALSLALMVASPNAVRKATGGWELEKAGAWRGQNVPTYPLSSSFLWAFERNTGQP